MRKITFSDDNVEFTPIEMVVANQVTSPNYYKSATEKYDILLTLPNATSLKQISFDTTNGSGLDLGTISGPCTVN